MAVAFRNYCTGILRFPPPLRAALTANGVTTFDDLQEIHPETGVEHLITAIREPGGMIPNPNAAIAGQPPTIRDPGTRVMNHQVLLLQQLVYYVFSRHYHLQSAVLPAQATIEELHRVWGFYQQYKEVKDNDVPMPEKYKSSTLKETLEAIEHCLSQTFGAIGLPLTYLIRDEVDPPAEAPHAQPSWADMIRRARHDGRFYAIDNKKLWDILYAVFFDTDGWTWIVGFQHANNGRGAYFAFRAHFLGDGTRNTMFARAEGRLRALHYEGERRNFTFNTFIDGIKIKCRFD